MISCQRLSCLLLLLAGSTSFAHNGDHAGMTDAAQQLHHLGLPLALVTIALAAVAAVRLHRSTRRAANDGASGR